MNLLLIQAYLRARSLLHSLTSRRRPPRRMPNELTDEFTLGQRIPVQDWYVNDAVSGPLTWTRRMAAVNQRRVELRKRRYYGDTDGYLYESLDKYPIQGKRVVIVGSESPWYECISLYFGAQVTTIEYRKVQCDIPNLTVLTPAEFALQPQTFDVVMSISSIEHDGLGRYGDPINPRGDLAAMDHFKTLLKPSGQLILAVPIGNEAVVWNAHRIYGRIRLPMLLEGWRLIDSFGFSEDSFNAKPGRWDLQPVFVLQPEAS